MPVEIRLSRRIGCLNGDCSRSRTQSTAHSPPGRRGLERVESRKASVRPNLRRRTSRGRTSAMRCSSGRTCTRRSFGGANLAGANLERAVLVTAALADAVLTGCPLHGISAWNVKLSEGTRQQAGHNAPPRTRGHGRQYRGCSVRLSPAPAEARFAELLTRKAETLKGDHIYT